VRELLERVAETIADYRAGELPPPDADHVGRWVAQFEQPVREPLLRALAHVLEKTYLSKARCQQFIDMVAASKQLAGEDPAAFWRAVSFLRIQQGGNSQKDMMEMFAAVLKARYGIAKLLQGQSGTYIYLDDVSFSGNRVLNDLRAWIVGFAPQAATVYIVVLGSHNSGRSYANLNLRRAAREAGKALEFKWKGLTAIEDDLAKPDASDVLRPTSIPADPLVQAYVAAMQHKPGLRTPGTVGKLDLFSSDAGRQLLEHELLKAGCRVREMCPNLPVRHRPLGFSFLETLGFGTMMVTYRNCPNNAPLALWAGHPWYPLFARKNN
jgi:hypothetical protein